MTKKLTGLLLCVGSDDADFLTMMQPDEAEGFGKVTVVRHQGRAIIEIQPSIIEEVNGQIDVGPLLLGAQDSDACTLIPWIGELRLLGATEEIAIVNRELWDVVLKSPDERLLTDMLVRIGGCGIDQGGEVLDLKNIVLRLE